MKNPTQKDSQYIKNYGGIYEENFDINKIEIGKYEVRKNTRTEEHINQLAEDIRGRGQLECAHIVMQEDAYHLIAGYSRYYALKKIGATTIRALIYSNLSEEDIHAFAIGTNEFRVAMSLWEKMSVVAQFNKDFPEIKVSTQKKGAQEKTLVDIFGMSRSAIQRCIASQDYFSKNKLLYDYLGKRERLSQAMLEGIYGNRHLIKSENKTLELIDFLENVQSPGSSGALAAYRSMIEDFLSDKVAVDTIETKWKAAEISVKDFIIKMDGVAKVNDVSQQNLGYDLEVITSKGEQFFVETKSVSSIEEPFTLTNNEYSCANKYKEKYIIALIAIREKAIVKYIQDPAKKLSFERKVIQWVWTNNNHDNEVSDHIAFSPE